MTVICPAPVRTERHNKPRATGETFIRNELLLFILFVLPLVALFNLAFTSVLGRMEEGVTKNFFAGGLNLTERVDSSHRLTGGRSFS
jgi:hypothetical protein